MKIHLKHSDAELINLVKQGKSQAFRQLVQRHEQQVRSTVIGMLGSIPEADDVAQEVFVRFYQKISSFRGDAQLGTYLSRIAINLSLNELKSRQRRNRWLTFMKKEDYSPAIEDRSSNPERQDMQDTIHKALQQLEPGFRSVVVLRLVEGYSVKEAAEILQLPTGTIASRLARAQKKLKEILKGWDQI